MPELLHHQLPVATRTLVEELRDLLAEADAELFADLHQRLSEARSDKAELVFTGPYSTGKSTLIKALTDGEADVVIAPGIATETVTAFDWNDAVRLIDTPGVHAGIPKHDELAIAAITRADLVVFTVTVELFDDDSTAQLRYVLDTLGKRQQTMVVITKSSTMAAAPRIRADAVAAAAGGDTVSFEECDARDYLHALEISDVSLRFQLVELSNMDAVGAKLNELARQRGQLARYRQPLQLVAAIAVEANDRVVDDPIARATLILVARQLKALNDRELIIDAQSTQAFNEFMRDCSAAAEAFADGIEDLDAADEAFRDKEIESMKQRLELTLNQAWTSLAANMNSTVATQLRVLAAEVLEIEAGPSARLIEQVAEFSRDVPGLTQNTPYHLRAHKADADVRRPSWLPRALELLDAFQVRWGAGDGLKQASGTLGHDLVLRAGHLFDHKFKPWEAVRLADRVGKIAKYGAKAAAFVGPILEAGLEESRKNRAEEFRFQRRRRIVDETLRQAHETADEALRNFRLELHSRFADNYDDLEALRNSIVTAQVGQNALRSSLERIASEARRLQAITSFD